MSSNRRNLVAVLLVGAALLGACSDGASTETTDSTAASTSITSTTEATEQHVDDAAADEPETTTTTEDEDALAPGLTTTTAPAPDLGATYRVAFVEDGDNELGEFELTADVLNVRAEPSADAALAGTLAPGVDGIAVTGDAERVGSSDWVPIETADGVSGWVNRRFLVRDISADDFCTDTAPVTALAQFISALADANDVVLGDVIDPGRGVWYSLDGGPPFEPVRGGDAPFAEPARDWYVQDGTGDVINGTYGDVVAPLLLDALGGGGSVTCNSYEVGGSAGFTSLVRGHEYVNFLAIHRPPFDNELDWATAVVGLDLDEDQQWVVVSVVRFNWLI